MRRFAIIALLALVALLVAKSVIEQGRYEPLDSLGVEIVDGDTIRAGGKTIRLVGVDTPEMASHARCERERTLALRATGRLRQLVRNGALELRLVPCACPRGTEGTPTCNHGRSCGLLRAGGRDVGDILIAEQLARPYRCHRSSCPPRSDWCS